jgi:hypothetical protein
LRFAIRHPELAQEQNVRAVMIFAENLERFVEWWASLVDKLTNPRLPSDQLLFLRFRAGAVLAISLVKCRKKFGARLDRAEADRRSG